MCLPLLIFPCTIKSRSSLLAPAHLGGPRKMAVKRLWCGGGLSMCYSEVCYCLCHLDDLMNFYIVQFCFLTSVV